MSHEEQETIEQETRADVPAMISDIDDMVRQGLVEVLAALAQQQQTATATIDGLRSELSRVAEVVAQQLDVQPTEIEAAEPVLPPQAVPIATPVVTVEPVHISGDAGVWEATLLGPELCNIAYLAQDRQALLAGLMRDHPPAQALVGQVLAFRACGDERRAQLLKEVGEAYYAWRPEFAQGEDAFREALIGILTAGCQAIGVNNSIELVRPGDRFDSKRHNAKSRGIEITDVYGWIVLRENGSVYTKASVAAK